MANAFRPVNALAFRIVRQGRWTVALNKNSGKEAYRFLDVLGFRLQRSPRHDNRWNIVPGGFKIELLVMQGEDVRVLWESTDQLLKPWQTNLLRRFMVWTKE